MQLRPLVCKQFFCEMRTNYRYKYQVPNKYLIKIDDTFVNTSDVVCQLPGQVPNEYLR